MTRNTIVLTTISALLLSFPSVGCAEDGFTAIHSENQKVGSPIFIYWRIVATLGEVPAFLADVPEAEIGDVWATMHRLTEESPVSASSCHIATAW